MVCALGLKAQLDLVVLFSLGSAFISLPTNLPIRTTDIIQNYRRQSELQTFPKPSLFHWCP